MNRGLISVLRCTQVGIVDWEQLAGEILSVLNLNLFFEGNVIRITLFEINY